MCTCYYPATAITVGLFSLFWTIQLELKLIFLQCFDAIVSSLGYSNYRKFDRLLKSFFPFSFTPLYWENPAETVWRVFFPNLSVWQSGGNRKRMCVCVWGVTKTMKHHSRLGNYGYNAGLSCKSSFKQNTRAQRTTIMPVKWDSSIHSLIYQNTLMTESEEALSRLQGVTEICDDDNGVTEASTETKKSIHMNTQVGPQMCCGVTPF